MALSPGSHVEKMALIKFVKERCKMRVSKHYIVESDQNNWLRYHVGAVVFQIKVKQ